MPQKTSEKKLAAWRRWSLNNPDKVRENVRRWRENNPEKSKAASRKQNLGQYGLTLADFEALNRKQNGLCCICQKTCSKHKVLSVDHCHKTGRVRGLLCDGCNKGLGHFKDDFSTLIRAANHIGWKN